jgi:hypothetical protein
VSLLLLLSAQDLTACALLFATVAVTASGQFLSFDYIEPMSGTLGKASRLTLHSNRKNLAIPSYSEGKARRLTYLDERLSNRDFTSLVLRVLSQSL